MLDGPSVAATLVQCGVTHVVWVPDSVLGAWDAALASEPRLRLIRVCREGEAFGVAAGLLIGGARPVVFLQCTGLFEAGDALRNTVHDLKLPVVFLVGVRSYLAHRSAATADNCPHFTEPVLKAWEVPYVVLDDKASAAELKAAIQEAFHDRRAGAVLLAE